VPWLLHRRCGIGVAALLVLALLAACSPPPELSGRPTTPSDVVARTLLPPGGAQQVVDAAAIDAAAVQATGGGRFAAFRFGTADAALGALARWRDRRLGQSGVSSSQSVDVGALHYTRYVGVGVHGLGWVSGTWLFTVEAPDAAALAALIEASGAGGVGAAGWAGSPSTVAVVVGLVVAAIVLVTFLLVRLLLGRLAVSPAAGISAVDRAALEQRLLALNAPDRPWMVRRDDKADLVVEWKFADATWWGLLAKSGLRKAYRLRLCFDETRHRCGALDEFGDVEWSAGVLGAPRVHFQRSFFRGVQLVRKERGIAYGFKTPTGGGAGKALDYSFDIDALKQPVIEAVTAGGWTYRPILWPRRRRG
jgi:hypothetical protein